MPLPFRVQYLFLQLRLFFGLLGSFVLCFSNKLIPHIACFFKYIFLSSLALRSMTSLSLWSFCISFLAFPSSCKRPFYGFISLFYHAKDGFPCEFCKNNKEDRKISTDQKIVPIAGDVRLLLARIISFVFNTSD